MGTVYLAEQRHPIKRKVALKVIRPGMDSASVIARFEAERQALAILDHANIAHVFEAGTTEKGHPYFVMEHVKGIPITEHCDRYKLSIEDRLGLFLQVCQAIHHAHQKGIIHRDIKPSNILVSIQDDQAVPKVIDFGVAKAVSQPLTDRTLHTEQGQLVGTPEFMSPEQVESANQNIDTRSDIYSLGVLLYVLLTGVLPFDCKTLREGGMEHIRQVICEEDPKTPSTKLNTIIAEELATLAKLRRMDIRSLGRKLHGDLDWITLMAMSKERTRRYETINALALDIRRYLNCEPVLAGPPSTIYRFRKFVRKHRVSVTATIAVAAALLVGLVVSIAMFLNAREQRRRAERLLATSQTRGGVRLLNEGNRLGLLDLLEARATADKIPDLRDSAARLWAIAHDLWSDQLVHVTPGGQDIAISPDGKLLAIAKDNFTQLWDMSTGEKKGPALQLEETIDAVLFSPDAKLLAATSKAGVARLWNPLTGESVGPILQYGQVLPMPSSSGAPRSAAFSPDGKLLAIATRDRTVQLWQTDTGKLHCQPILFPDEVISMAFSPDSKWLATGTHDSKAKLWRIATEESGGPTLQHTFQLRGWVERVAFSPDGKLLAAASNNGITSLWHTDTGQLHKQLTRHEWMHDLAFSPDGKILATGSFDWTVQLWDTETGKTLSEKLPHNGRVRGVAFSPDGRLLASRSTDCTVRLWLVATGQPYGQPLRHTGVANKIMFSPDSKLLITTETQSC